MSLDEQSMNANTVISHTNKWSCAASPYSKPKLPMVHTVTNAEWRSLLWNTHTTEIATVPPVGMLGTCIEETVIRHYHSHYHTTAGKDFMSGQNSYVASGVKLWKDVRNFCVRSCLYMYLSIVHSPITLTGTHVHVLIYANIYLANHMAAAQCIKTSCRYRSFNAYVRMRGNFDFCDFNCHCWH